MAALFALLSALSYGASDFGAGVASRRLPAEVVALCTQSMGVTAAAVAVAIIPGVGPDVHGLAWGAASGLGSALGTLALYRGLAVARMSLVATLAGVLTAAIPAAVGLIGGDHLSPPAVVGLVLALPAIAMVAAHSPESTGRPSTGPGILLGLLAGTGFAALFIALDRAGTRSGAWPVLAGQVVCLVLVVPFALRARRTGPVGGQRRTAALALGAGVLSGLANLLYLAATGRGQLSVVAVLASLYPAATVVLARVVLAERWSRRQAAGLLVAAVAVALVSAG